MAILGVGTDIVEIARIEAALSRSARFADRILTEPEQAQMAATQQPGRYLAKRFAAKEAAAKALGTGIAQGVSFQDFTVSNQPSGQPVLTLSGKAQQLAIARGVSHCWLTLSDEKAYAVAHVILEGTPAA
ncbi:MULTISPECIES: holo-ACP synthase [Salinivibrio]|jgi:holo-[acyl-carrier protein] synthase|uniref:Holo-[acyl-carrier-protein] synthase n=2 Tax=Salinivibrio TaxID=51366 RepID=A0ABY7LF84_9GAMM|nr:MULTISPECIES: holo-ACP synthase [Salinivibrio]ODP95553.1 holo-ACP synthase [Salinivibrio sp. DV]PCE68975.1 holo-ACP synthase [Salinivibrio sp. YCSC6]QCF36595.1 holo-ACP synthase [Salinivibrio sp. YCSC6]QIR05425.1 holo-ACP synthase [Salinivibrio costicola]WBA15282.1 holo-ACP synthase [Salinivibrio proteolyticus]